MTEPAPKKMSRKRSEKAFDRAQSLMPGGVNSPVRAYRAVGCDPVFIKEGHGAVVTDVDGNSYVDYVGSYGPLILGHAPQGVVAAINKATRHGTTFGMPTQLENALAAAVIEAVPSVEMVRFVNSGTEACMSALRLARAATKRDKIIKCTGCYHGHADTMLVQAGSGATTLGTPSSPGVSAETTTQTVLVPFNSAEAVKQAFSDHAGEIGAMILEPVAGNMGCIPPHQGYLEAVRELCDEAGALLIFDEVMTGFRVALGGAQQLYGIKPDLTCMGKVVGGGLPCAAYGGRRDLMEMMAPSGPVYQAGTLSGNPLAMAAGLATLEVLQGEGIYKQLEQTSDQILDGILAAATRHKVTITGQRVGSMLTIFFHPGPIENYQQATESDTELFAVFFRGMLDRGVVLPPSQFEAWFVGSAHGEDQIKQTLTAADGALADVAAFQTNRTAK